MVSSRLFTLLKAVLLLTAALLAGCSSLPNDVGPTYELVTASNISDPLAGLRKANEYLKGRSYETKTNPVFNTIETQPIELGYLRWRANNEKWLVRYQVGLQTLAHPSGRVYWRLSSHIVGTRSGRQPRAFSESDFEETDRLFFKLRQEISELFSVEV